MTHVKNINLRMKEGDDETSYANSSALQKFVIIKTREAIDETIRDMVCDEGFDKSARCLRMADLGCASGPNALLVISIIMETVGDLVKKKGCLVKEVEFFLNDLPDNDFNNLFKLLQKGQVNLENGLVQPKCFVYGLPGSFYGRLFQGKSLHFAYSSYSLHWLSQVPEGLLKKNKENITMSTKSPPEVLEAYGKQFERDFFNFLNLRGQEMVSGGCMVLAFTCRSFEDPYSRDEYAFYNLVGETLLDMVAEDAIKEDDVHSFNLPYYMPCRQEIEAIISCEGSFELDKVTFFPVRWDMNDNINDDFVPFDPSQSAKVVAKCIRALLEPMLTSHFGGSLNCDSVFERYARKIAERFAKEGVSSYSTILLSLSRRGI